MFNIGDFVIFDNNYEDEDLRGVIWEILGEATYSPNAANSRAIVVSGETAVYKLGQESAIYNNSFILCDKDYKTIPPIIRRIRHMQTRWEQRYAA